MRFHQILSLECFIFAGVFLAIYISLTRRKKKVAKRWWNGDRFTTTVRLEDYMGRVRWRKVG